MENFYDSQITALEVRVAQQKFSRKSNPTLHNESAPAENLYYVKWVLGTGRVQLHSNSKETPSLPMQATEPNERLISQLSKFLNKIKVTHSLKKIAGTLSVIIQFRERFQDVTTLLIQSKPLNGISYVHITKLSTDNLGMQLSASFVAHTPEMIVAKLMDHGSMQCPKFAACLTHCSECPEL